MTEKDLYCSVWAAAFVASIKEGEYVHAAELEAEKIVELLRARMVARGMPIHLRNLVEGE